MRRKRGREIEGKTEGETERDRDREWEQERNTNGERPEKLKTNEKKIKKIWDREWDSKLKKHRKRKIDFQGDRERETERYSGRYRNIKKMDIYVYTGIETVGRDRNKEGNGVEKIFKKRLKKR